MNFIIFCLIAYIIGSIPVAYLVSKIFYKVDIRTLGSGNSGTSNVFRNFGLKPAIPVLLLDFLKGYLATSLSSDPQIQLFIVLSVLLGHIFPVFTKFKGGKGVATSLGAFLAINPFLVILPFMVWILILITTRISSLASILAVLSLTVSNVIFNTHIVTTLLTLLVCTLILFTHRQNIHRLLSEKEDRLF